MVIKSENLVIFGGGDFDLGDFFGCGVTFKDHGAFLLSPTLLFQDQPKTFISAKLLKIKI